MAKQILVVDDELFLIRSIEFLLRREGYEVITASNGDEALKIVAQEKPDLIFLDIMMPEVDGFEVCRMIKNQPETKDIYIVILTAKAEDIDYQKAFEMGADDYMYKPFSPRKLLSYVKGVFEK